MVTRMMTMMLMARVAVVAIAELVPWVSSA